MTVRIDKKSLLVVVLLVWVFLTNAHGQGANESASPDSSSPSISRNPAAQNLSVAEESLFSMKGLRNVSAAFIVGTLGASAFFFGVFFGFILRQSRAQTIEFLTYSKTGQAKFWPLKLFSAL